jgi:hypothetical protein
MGFRTWLEAAIGSTDQPLYHFHWDVLDLKKTGFTEKNVDQPGTGIASTNTPQGGRIEYGAGACIHLTRNLKWAVSRAKNLPKGAGVVEVIFHARKPIFIPETQTAAGKSYFKAFVDPENKRLTVLGDDKEENIRKIALVIANLKTAHQIFNQSGGLGLHGLSERSYPLPIQAKILAKEFVNGMKGCYRTGWPIQFRKANPVFEEDHMTTLGPFKWHDWAKKGYLDSVWWESKGEVFAGPFHGEAEVSVFNPKLLRVGNIVFINNT